MAAACPVCARPLERITYLGGVLNAEQWASSRAGDWWCPSCPDNGRGRRGAYYWEQEVSPVSAHAPPAKPQEAR